MRAILLAAAIVGLSFLAGPADACCHLYELREDAGPCYAEWRGDGFHLITESVEVGCAGESVRVTP